MDKGFLLEQLGAMVRERLLETHRSSSEARADARSGAARAVNLALGQGQRDVQAREALDALDAFRPRPMGRAEAIGLGALVEVEDDDSRGRTLFLAPVGAGEELEGPGGDGIFHVITPGSPFGRAVMGRHVGDVVEVRLAGEVTEWTITHAQ
jgi:transcription elongation GreA/GreB family factor